MNMLRQVIYVSRATGVPSRTAEKQILGVSQRNNRRSDVTGILASTGEHFLQVLEGPAAAVEATLARIATDPRHDGMTVLADRATGVRRFADWSMAYVYSLDFADELGHLCAGEVGIDLDGLLGRLRPDTLMGGL